jgi:hypothetical protein
MNPLEYAIQYIRFVHGYPIFNFDYDENQNVSHIGLALRGTLDSQNRWLIVQFSYNDYNQVLTARLSQENVAWDDRLSVQTIYA